MKYFIYLVAALMVSACGVTGTPEDSTKVRARAEEEAGTEVQNKNNAQKAARMEVELSNWHNYYKAITGTYEGDISTDTGPYKIRVTFVPSILPYSGKRVRELSEIESDINNLFFFVDVVQWNPSVEGSGVPCSATVKPDIYTGSIIIKRANDCPNSYQIYLSAMIENKSSNDVAGGRSTDEIAKSISDQIQNGGITYVNRIIGTLRSKEFSYNFDASRRK